MPPAMPAIANPRTAPETIGIDPERLKAKSLQLIALRRSFRRDRRPDAERPGARNPGTAGRRGTRTGAGDLGGHLRTPAAGLREALGLAEVPCQVRRPAARGRQADARSWNTTASAARRSVNSCARPTRSRSSGDREAGARRLANLRQGDRRRDRIRPTTPNVGIPTIGPCDEDSGAGCRRARRIASAPAGAGPMRRSPGTSAWGARTSTGRPGPSGDWPARVTPGRRAASPSSTPGPRPSMRPTRTCAVATASGPTSARRRTTSGRSGTTGPSASPTPAPSRRPWWRMRSTTTRPPAPWWSTRWPAAGPRSTSASRWDADAWPTTSIPPAPRSAPTTSALGFPPEAVRLRPHLLRPALSHHAGTPVRP